MATTACTPSLHGTKTVWLFIPRFCVALAALDAQVTITGSNQQVNHIPFKDFHRLPGFTPEQDNNLPVNAIIQSIEIPANAFHKNYAYVKLRDRDSYAFALVSVAAALTLQGNKIAEARLASGGVAHKPWRWFEAENLFKRKTCYSRKFRQPLLLRLRM